MIKQALDARVTVGIALLVLPLLVRAQSPNDVTYNGLSLDANPGTSTVQSTPMPGKTANTANGDNRGWRLRLDFSWVNPSGSIDFVDTDPGFDFDLDTGFGIGLRGEYRFSDRLGVELGVLGTANISLSTGISRDRFQNEFKVGSFSPLSVGLNVHLTPDSPIDLYIGPQVALVKYGSIDFWTVPGSSEASLSVDDDIGVGAILGLDVPVGDSGWMFHSSLRYLSTDAKYSSEGFSFKNSYDPMIFSLGVGYRF